MYRLSSKLHLLWQRGKPLCSNLCCSLQTGSELAHIHPQRTLQSQCQGLGGNQWYKVLRHQRALVSMSMNSSGGLQKLGNMCQLKIKKKRM